MTELSTAAKRLLALLFVLIVVSFVAGSVLIYKKAFTDVHEVDLLTDDIGFNLPRDADVKVNGVTVGQVRGIDPDSGGVRVHLAIEPDQAARLPANVTARLLPKTLFGERYVALQLPRTPSGELADTDRIQQDRAGNATELGRVLDGLLPVLQAVPPEKLAQTLGALNQALAGNGDRLGASVVELGRVFAGIQEVQPQLESGIRDLATFSQTYSEAAPELISALDALRTTGNLVVRRRDDLATGLDRLIAGSTSTTELLRANRESLIALAADSRTGLDYLARYSPALPCAVRQFHGSLDRSDAILGVGTPNPGIRVTVEIVNPRGRYVPNQDEPRNFETRGPACYEPAAPGANFGQTPGGAFADGAYQPPSRNPGPETVPVLPDPRAGDGPVPAPRTRGSVPAAPGRAVPEQPNDPLPPSVTGQDDGRRALTLAGSPWEAETVRAVYAAAAGTDQAAVPGWVAALGAPALRGTEVALR